MQSLFLIDNLRKSLYTRLYYILVDSDYIIKALSDKEIKEMMDFVSAKRNAIENAIRQSRYADKKINYPNSLYKKRYEEIEEKYAKLDDSTRGYGAVKRREQMEAEIKSLNKRLGEDIAKKYPLENLETQLITQYIEDNHSNETVKDVKNQLEDYRLSEFDKRMEQQRQINTEREPQRLERQRIKDRNKRIFDEKWKKAQEKFKKLMGSRDKKSKIDILIEDWMKSTVNTRPEDYRNMTKLLDFVGSLKYTDSKTIPRLKKFLSEEELSSEDKNKLNKILEELEKEQKQREKKIGRSSKITPNAAEAKSEGIKVGRKSKIFRKHISIKYAGTESLKIKNTDYFLGFEKLDLRIPTWYNSTILRDIPMYWIEKSGFTKGLDKWEDLPEDEKTKYIKKIVGQLPEYPKVKPLGTLESLYRNVWERHYKLDNKEDPENFAYFVQGIRDGLMETKGDSAASDFLSLKMFKEDTLPKLVKAIKSNIVVNTETGTIDFRLGPAFGKLMRKYKTMEERTDIIEDLIDIVRGKSLSTKYAGRNAQELKSIENDIIEMVSEKIEGETVLSYIISTFISMYPSTKILSRLFKEEKPVVEVKYLTPMVSKPTLPKREQKKTGVKLLLRRNLDETKKSLDNLLVVMGEEDDIIIKEDVGIILESLNNKQKKKVKAILNIADPTEYFGHDFLKLSELVRVLKTLGVVKGDKKLNKKILRLEDENIKVVKLAARLRKDYERLYKQLREMIYPKLGDKK